MCVTLGTHESPPLTFINNFRFLFLFALFNKSYQLIRLVAVDTCLIL